MSRARLYAETTVALLVLAIAFSAVASTVAHVVRGLAELVGGLLS